MLSLRPAFSGDLEEGALQNTPWRNATAYYNYYYYCYYYYYYCYYYYYYHYYYYYYYYYYYHYHYHYHYYYYYYCYCYYYYYHQHQHQHQHRLVLPRHDSPVCQDAYTAIRLNLRPGACYTRLRLHACDAASSLFSYSCTPLSTTVPVLELLRLSSEHPVGILCEVRPVGSGGFEKY